MCRRAGKIILGFDSVKDSVCSGKAFCICTSGDISPKTLKECAYLSNREGVLHLKLDLTMEDIWNSLGRKAGVLSICDEGFANRLEAILNEPEAENP